MQQIVFKYKVTKAIEDWAGGKPFISHKVNFVVRYMANNSTSYLEVEHLSGKESHRMFHGSGSSFIEQRMRRRDVLEQALVRFFSALPDQINDYFELIGEDHYNDGKLTFSI